MISRLHPDFRAAFVQLPDHVQHQARAAYRLFQQNPHHPGLHFAPVAPDIYSVRIGLHYRALGRRHDNTIIWFWIGSHAEYDHLIRRR